MNSKIKSTAAEITKMIEHSNEIFLKRNPEASKTETEIRLLTRLIAVLYAHLKIKIKNESDDFNE